jgi:capsular polysaccharide biosynthesis protein
MTMQADLELEQDTPAWHAPVAARSMLLVFWHRKAFVLLGAFLGLALGFLWHTQRAPVYQSTCQLLVIKKRGGDALPVQGGDPRLSVVEDYMATHLALLRSPMILERAVKKRELGSLKMFENVGDPAATILANLVVARDTKDTGTLSNIIVLTFRGSVAEDCGKVLAAILESYQEFLDITYRNVSDQTLELITKARDMLKRDLSESEDRYLKFRQGSRRARTRGRRRGQTFAAAAAADGIARPHPGAGSRDQGGQGPGHPPRPADRCDWC